MADPAARPNAPTRLAMGHVNARGVYVPIAEVRHNPETGRSQVHLGSEVAHRLHGKALGFGESRTLVYGPGELSPHDLSHLLGIPRAGREAIAKKTGRDFDDLDPATIMATLEADRSLSALVIGKTHDALDAAMRRDVLMTPAQVFGGKGDLDKARAAFRGRNDDRRVLLRRETTPEGSIRFRPVDVERADTPEDRERLAARHATIKGMNDAKVHRRHTALHVDPHDGSAYLISDRPGARSFPARKAPDGGGLVVRRGQVLGADLEVDPELMIPAARSHMALGRSPSEALIEVLNGQGSGIQRRNGATASAMQTLSGVFGGKASGYAATLDLPADSEKGKFLVVGLAAGDGLMPDGLAGTPLHERLNSGYRGTVPAMLGAEALQERRGGIFHRLDRATLTKAHAQGLQGAEAWEKSWSSDAVQELLGPEAAQEVRAGRRRAVGGGGPLTLHGEEQLTSSGKRSYGDFLASRNPRQGRTLESEDQPRFGS